MFHLGKISFSSSNTYIYLYLFFYLYYIFCKNWGDYSFTETSWKSMNERFVVNKFNLIKVIFNGFDEERSLTYIFNCLDEEGSLT